MKKMLSFAIQFLMALSMANLSIAKERSNREIVRDIQVALKERDKVRFQEKLAVETFREELKHLSDSEKIRGIYQILLDQDKQRKYHMSSYVGERVLWAKARDPHLIKDYSELKKMLRQEENPRRFYLLAGLMTRTTAENKYNFIPEMAHMLFKDGRVLRDEGAYTRPYSRDVSRYAYTHIGWILKAYGRQITIPKELTHDQEAVILAKWLKQNWPGCEKLVIPDKFLKMNVPEVKEPVKYVKPKSPIQPRNEASKEKETNHIEKATSPNKSKSNPKENSQHSTEVQPNSNSNNKNSHIVWLVLGSLLSVILISIWFIKRKS